MVMKTLPRAKRVAVTPECFYIYRRNDASATYKAFDDHYRDFIRVYERAEPEIREKYPECVSGILFRQDLAYFMVLDKMFESRVPSTTQNTSNRKNGFGGTGCGFCAVPPLICGARSAL